MTDTDKIIAEARAEMLPLESCERLTGETSAAFAAFCVYRDFGLTGISAGKLKMWKKTRMSVRYDTIRYRFWRNWSTQFRWR